MGNCLTISADDGYGGARGWDSHPEHANWIEIHELGHGNFSKVVLAKHAYEKGRVAALKIVFVNDPMLDEETKALLVQEGRLLHELSHPNLITCRHIYPSENGVLIYELEYLEGLNVLEGIYTMRSTYSERDAARIFKQIVEAVGYLHDQGVIHRDIKPENVVFRDAFHQGMSVEQFYASPVVKLLDLGLAWRMDGGSSASRGGSPVPSEMRGPTAPTNAANAANGTSRSSDSESETDGVTTKTASASGSAVETGCIGSPGFIAPEVVFDKPHTPAMDVYGLGVLLFIMLVGRKPFDSNQSESLEYAMIPLKDAPGLKDPRWLDLSPDAKHLILGMMRDDPKRRLSCKQVLQHEWIRSEGGLTLRHLGEDVAMGAATVGEMRRLRYLDRAVSSAMETHNEYEYADSSKRVGSNSVRGFRIQVSSRASSGDLSAKTSKDKYLAALDKSVRRGKSTHGGSAMEHMARSLTAKSYSMAHDGGRSVHGKRLEASVHGRSVHGRLSRDASMHNSSKKIGSSGHGLRELGKAVSGYIEGRSVHGRGIGMSRSSSRGSGLNLQGLASRSMEKLKGIQAAEEMNERWRNSIDGSGSVGRTVRALKPLEQEDN